MRKFLFALLGMLAALGVNSAVGATIACVFDFNPIAGIAAVNGMSAASALCGGFMPSGVLAAGIYPEAWTGELIKAFRTAAESIGWYNAIRAYDSYVKADAIHFVDVGADPEILVNNTTYPLTVQELPDGDKSVQLDKFQSRPTPITDDELHAIGYDKMALVIEKHKDMFFEKKYSRAIHSLAPAENTAKTPVITTTGEATSDGRKKLTRADIVSLKSKFDKLRIPKEGRILVLCADHVADLLETDQRFERQMYDYTTGKIAKMYGFDVYEYDECPYYDTTTLKKKAYGAVIGDNDRQCSVAFTTKRAMRADGSTKSYLRPADLDPENQQNIFSMRTYTICLPLRNEGFGAIVSAKAASETPAA
ncbi:MAG: hypothetical protein V8Q54_03395 [Alistipes senegalensis]